MWQDDLCLSETPEGFPETIRAILPSLLPKGSSSTGKELRAFCKLAAAQRCLRVWEGTPLEWPILLLQCVSWHIVISWSSSSLICVSMCGDGPLECLFLSSLLSSCLPPVKMVQSSQSWSWRVDPCPSPQQGQLPSDQYPYSYAHLEG